MTTHFRISSRPLVHYFQNVNLNGLCTGTTCLVFTVAGCNLMPSISARIDIAAVLILFAVLKYTTDVENVGVVIIIY